MMPSKRNSLPLTKKVEIIQEVEKGTRKKAAICQEYGIPTSTLSTIMKNRDKILKAFEGSAFQMTRKRLRTSKNLHVEEATLMWFHQARAAHLPVSGPLLMEKASQFAAELGVDFKPSAGWLQRFKNRHSIVFKNVWGHCASVDESAIKVIIEAASSPADCSGNAASTTMATRATTATAVATDQDLHRVLPATVPSSHLEHLNAVTMSQTDRRCLSRQEEEEEEDGPGSSEDSEEFDTVTLSEAQLGLQKVRKYLCAQPCELDQAFDALIILDKIIDDTAKSRMSPGLMQRADGSDLH